MVKQGNFITYIQVQVLIEIMYFIIMVGYGSSNKNNAGSSAGPSGSGDDPNNYAYFLYAINSDIL